MATPINTLLIEGSFTELVEELAQYVDAIRRTAPENSVRTEIGDALEQLREKEQSEQELTATQQQQVLKERDDVLKKVVVAASFECGSRERWDAFRPSTCPCARLLTCGLPEITPSYNLLIHLIRQSGSVSMFLARICNYLTNPFPSSPQNGPTIALSILSTVFNTLSETDESRYHVFLAILGAIRRASSALAFEALKSQLKNQLPAWLEAWELDEEDTQKLHLAIAEAANEVGDKEFSYDHLVAALQAVPASDASTPEARDLAKRTLTAALTYPFVFDFTPLTASDAIQSLRSTDTQLFELLEIFSADTLDTYEEFIESTPLSSIDKLAESAEVLQTKMRLLTLASLAASTPSRALPYDQISSSLRIPREDVEKWVIDTIRAGLVEGKLSQLKGEFLVQRATYRVFGERQWAEVQGRLMVWRRSLENVLGVVRSEREKFIREGMAAASGGAGGNQGAEGGARGQGDRRRGGGQQQQHPREIELVGAD
jgi:translation initiation factor 3 subunit M